MTTKGHTNEKYARQKIRQRLVALGCIVFAGGTGVASAGEPDFICCAPNGRFMGIEIKAVGGRLRPHQAVTLEDIRSRGGIGCVIRHESEVSEALWLNPDA